MKTALDIAEALRTQGLDPGSTVRQDAAEELLRLHAENQELLDACRTLMSLPQCEDEWIERLRLAVQKSKAAIEKSEVDLASATGGAV